MFNFEVISSPNASSVSIFGIFLLGALDGPLAHPCSLPLLQRRLQSQILVQEALISTFKFSRLSRDSGNIGDADIYAHDNAGTRTWRAFFASELTSVGSCLMLWFFNKVAESAETYLGQTLML